MIAVQLVLNVEPDSEIGLQTQIFEQIRAMILDGRLRTGDPLPATRLLCSQLSVSRNTLTLAYERLAAEGYIESRKSVGTFVSKQIPEKALYAIQNSPMRRSNGRRPHSELELSLSNLRSQALVNPHTRRLTADFWVGRPDSQSFPVKTWARLACQRILQGSAALTEYRDPTGLQELRQAICDHLRPARGIIAEPEQIIIVGGSQDGLNLVCRMLVRDGTVAVIESPTYQGAAYLLESLGVTLHPVPVDIKGLNVGMLPDLKSSVAYVTPSHQYPLGVTLSLDRRIELLAWAMRTNSYIIEDDYDSDFRFQGSPIAALKGLDRGERVIYMGTFSKCLGAGLRLGYVVLPSKLITAARHYKTLMNNGQPWLEQAVLADFMQSGDYGRHLRRIRKHYLVRRNALIAAIQRYFGECEVAGAEAGMHLAWRIPKRLPPASEIEAIALANGIGVYTLASGAAIHFGDRDDAERYLILGFSSLSESMIESGIAALAQALKTGRSSIAVNSNRLRSSRSR